MHAEGTFDVRYTDDDWSVRQDEAYHFIASQATLQRQTSYTELSAVLARRTGLRHLSFALDRDRAAMGELLGSVARRSFDDRDAVLSSIVLYLNENDAGSGLYALAIELGLLDTSWPKQRRWELWVQHVAKTHSAFER
ncbi:hypothetical protein [Demequina sp. NBRC 110052]|uniref:hypothetical protein n=1 Tax=Demequina sp. NBRC 110052 TaxID=1570341 RepID=UPI00135637A4|nr:hypothetical protein [Demequina sp. NBRC 110052]